MGGANAIITAIIQARDLATPTIQRVAAASRTASMGQIQNMTNLSRAVRDATKNYDEHLAKQRAYEQNTQRMGISTGRLITMMVKFGIILKALQLITSPLKLVGEGIRDLIATDRGVREITGMLREQGDTAVVLAKRYVDLTAASRNLQRQFGFTAKDSVAGLYDVASVIQTLNITGFANDNAEAIIKLTQEAGKLAIAGFMPLEEATSGLTTVFNALNLPVTNVGDVMDIMFNAVKIGKGHMSDLTANMGAFLEVLGDLTTEDTRLKSFQETMGIFGYLTTVVSAPRAGTAVKRLLESVAARTPEQQDLISSIQNAFGIDLSAARFAGQGPADYFGALIGAVGPQSPQLAAFVQSRLGYAASEAQLTAISTGILEKFTGDKRAATALLSMKPGQMQDVFGVMAQRGSAGMAEQEALQAYETRWNIFTQRISVIAQTLQQNTLPKIMGFFDGVSQVLEDTMGTQQFANMSTGTQLQTIITNLADRFQNWFVGGGRQQREGGTGREQIRDTMREWGTNAANIFMGAFGIALPGEVAKNRNYFYEAANTMVSSLVGGFADTIGKAVSGRGIGILGDIWNNPLGRGAGTFFGLLKMGVPWFLAFPLALAGGATASTDLGGLQGPAAIISTVSTAALLRRGIIGSKNLVMNEIVGPISGIPGVRRGTRYAMERGGAALSYFEEPITGAGSPLGPRGRGPGGRMVAATYAPGFYIPGQGYVAPTEFQTPPKGPGGQFVSPQGTPLAPSGTGGGIFTATGRLARATRRVGRGFRGFAGSTGMATASGMLGMGAGSLIGTLAAQHFAPDNELAQYGLGTVGAAIGATGAGMVILAGGAVAMALWETAQTIGVVVDNWDKVGIGLQNWWSTHFPGQTTGNPTEPTTIPGVPGTVTSQGLTMGATIPGMAIVPGATNPWAALAGAMAAGPGRTPPVLNINFDVDHLNMDKSQLSEFADKAYDAFVERFAGEVATGPNVGVGPMLTP